VQHVESRRFQLCSGQFRDRVSPPPVTRSCQETRSLTHPNVTLITDNHCDIMLMTSIVSQDSALVRPFHPLVSPRLDLPRDWKRLGRAAREDMTLTVPITLSPLRTYRTSVTKPSVTPITDSRVR